MRPFDIHSGMILELRGGKRYIVIQTDHGNILLGPNDNWLIFENKYNEDLTHKSNSEFDVLKVLNINSLHDGSVYYPVNLINQKDACLTLLWSRNCMTFDEAVKKSSHISHEIFTAFYTPATVLTMLIDRDYVLSEELYKPVWRVNK